MQAAAGVSLRTWGDLRRGGMIGGLIGGIVMAVVLMMVSSLRGMGALQPFYLIAAAFYRPWARVQGVDPGPLLIGVVGHLLLSALLGAVFAVVVGAVTRRGTRSTALWLAAGIVWGALLALISQFVALPLADPVMATTTGHLFAWWGLSYLLYGFVLGAIVASPAQAPTRLSYSTSESVEQS
jgi:hypothetical protein